MAEKSLDGQRLSREEMISILQSPDEDLLQLLHAAYGVRKFHFGNQVQLQVLMNAKSGLCSEDCAYCSQSSISSASIEKYPLLAQEQILEGARKAKEAGAYRYCIVTSGRAPTNPEVQAVSETVQAIKSTTDIEICCCLGILTEDQALTLKSAGVNRVNHNLNTAEAYHEKIVTSHTYEDRVDTILNCRKVGLDICCGGIVGLGETDDNILDLACALRDLDVDSIPVNFLHPIDGTPLSTVEDLTPQRCLKALCLFRFVNPTKEIRVAGGREHNLRSLQPLALYPANSLFMEGYLTTGGQNVEETHQMIEDMGFAVTTVRENRSQTELEMLQL